MRGEGENVVVCILSLRRENYPPLQYASQQNIKNNSEFGFFFKQYYEPHHLPMNTIDNYFCHTKLSNIRVSCKNNEFRPPNTFEKD